MKLHPSLFLLLLLPFGLAGADTLPGPVPQELIVVHDGLEWVWASPCSGLCSVPLPTYQDGWRYATGEEWESRPEPTDFLNPEGTVKCAAAYFDPVWQHCDWDDAVEGQITSLLDGERHESWFVRGGARDTGVPEPTSLVLVGSGLLALAGWRMRRY